MYLISATQSENVDVVKYYLTNANVDIVLAFKEKSALGSEAHFDTTL